MAINTGSYPKALTLGVKTWWGMEEDRHPLVHTQIFHTVTSDQNYEEYVQTVGGGLAPVKPEGAGVQYTNMNQGYTVRVTNVAFALGIIVTHEEIVDNKYPKLAKQRIMGLKDAHRESKELNHSSLLDNAFSSSFVGGDGVSLCNLSHVTAKGGTQQNMPTVSSGLSEKAIEDMLVLTMNALDDTGYRQRLSGRKLIVAPSNAFRATRILKTKGEARSQSGTGNNDLNAIRSLGLLPEGIVVNPYSNQSSYWYIQTDLRPEEGLITQERETLQLFEDNEFDTRNFKCFAYERYAPAWVNWRGIYGSQAS
jgi:hypothetical protein